MSIDLTHAGDPVRGASLVREAESALERGDRAGALEKLSEASGCEPHNDELALQTAVLLHEKGSYAEAAEYACTALRTRPYNPPALNVLGVVLIEADRPDLAVDVLRRCVRLAPGYVIARRNLKDARRKARRAGRQGSKPFAGLPVDDILDLLKRDPNDLSLCLLVRDEEADVGGCIASLQGLATEVVVLDARVDRSRSLDLPEDVKWLSHSWREDRAGACNRAVVAASGHWVLLLEDHERPDARSLSLMRSLLREERSLCHPCSVRYRQGGSVRMHASVRLLRNAPHVALDGRVFEHPVPEYLTQEAMWGLVTGEPGVLLAAEGEPAEAESARRQLERDLAENPGNCRAAFHRDWLDAVEGRAEEALASVRKIAQRRDGKDQAQDESWLETASTLEGFCLLRLERFADLAALMDDYHGRAAPTANTLFLQGIARKATGDAVGAMESLRAATGLAARVRFFHALPGIVGTGLWNILGAACLDARDLDGAEEAFRSALEIDAESLEARLGLVGVRSAQDQVHQVLEELDRLIEASGEDRRAWTAGAMVLQQIPGLGGAGIAWLEEAMRRFPGDGEFRERLGDAHLGCGNVEQALEVWDGIDAPQPRGLSGRLAACLLSERDLPSIPEERSDEVVSEMIGWYRSWIHNDSVETLDRALTSLGRAAQVLPRIRRETASWLDQVGQGEAARRVREGM